MRLLKTIGWLLYRSEGASPGYGAYRYEALYPTQTPCSGRYYLPPVPGGATRTVRFEGRMR